MDLFEKGEEGMLQIYETEKEYTDAMAEIRDQVVMEYKKYRKDNETDDALMKSLDATLGSKNVSFAKVDRKSFYNASEFRTEWFRGLEKSNNTELKMIACNDVLRRYIVLFLERMYIRNSGNYLKKKIVENDREIFLGSNDKLIGVFVFPRKEYMTKNKWMSHERKGLKAKYTYLTLGQLVAEGYLMGTIDNWRIDAKHVGVKTFEDVEKFYSFFKASGSPFEKQFIEKYIRYVKGEKEWEKVPMLLPEVRWGKDKKYHKYRTDYMIINYYTGERLAIELSPSSTHLIHDDIKADWKNENDKRNSYFFDYRVPTVTYTDRYLSNIDECFNTIAYMFERPGVEEAYEDVIKRLKGQCQYMF